MAVPGPDPDLVRIKSPQPLGYVTTRRAWMKPGDELYEEPPAAVTEDGGTPAFAEGFALADVDIGPSARQALEDAGLTSAEAVFAVGEDGLRAVKGVGSATAARVYAHAATFREE